MKRLILVGMLIPAVLAAQGFRISGVTTMQLVELRPLLTDSLAASAVPGTGQFRTAAFGVPAVCDSLFCHYERSGTRVSAVPVLQDLTLSAWGLAEGLSLHSDLRLRTELDNNGLIYPRSDDHVQLLDAYLQLDRDWGRARLGRQWVTGALGAYDFDGAEALIARRSFSVEGWAGRALVEGLNEPYTSSQLSAVDNLPPEQDGYIFGALFRVRPDALSAASVTYQRVILADHSGMYSERASLAASTRRLGLALDLTATYDLASGDWNEARLRAGTAGIGTIGYSVEARHSQPFFELWTIWGAFAPVGFNEARTTVDWRPRAQPFSASLHFAYRKYDPADAGISLRTSGWRAGGDASWRAGASLSAYGSYDVDIGNGASSDDGRAGVRWTAARGVTLGVEGSVTQMIYEYRIGTGRVYGAALNAAWQLNPDIRVVADGGIYQQTLTNGAAGPDWSQRRASLRLEWTAGSDPGSTRGRAP
jgi:hypothetical protein